MLNEPELALEWPLDAGESATTSAYERSVNAFRADPQLRAFVEKNYLDEDLAAAASRYSGSREFSRVCSFLEPHLSRGSRLADLGAGRGLTSLALAKKGAKVTAVESGASDVVGTGALLKLLKFHRESLIPVQADVLLLPFPKNFFDVVFCRSLLHHLSDLDQGLREICRTLKPGGVFLASNEHILSLCSDGSRFLRAHPAVAYGVDENAYHAVTYWWKFRKSGFRQIHFYGYPLEFPEFVEATRSNPVRARLIQLPLCGRVFARLFHGVHVCVRRYLWVREETLPALSIVAHKPESRSLEGSDAAE